MRDRVDAAFRDFYRCPESFGDFALTGNLSRSSGYFRLGPEAICYGRCSGGTPSPHVTNGLHDVMRDVVANENTLQLPFNPSEIAENLRYERYASPANGTGATDCGKSLLHGAYYKFRPLLPVAVRKYLQRIRLRDWNEIRFPVWPVDNTVELIFEKLLMCVLQTGRAEKIPFLWFWPDASPSCAIMTHDVETEAGRDFCSDLMDLDDSYGIKSSFQIVPEGRYPVSQSFFDEIRRRGFEINVHDLNHDGRLFGNRERFLLRAERINQYGREFGAEGFRSAVLYRNLDWYDALDFSYDMSVPSVGHMEAQRGGCCSVMPFFVGKILELPVTTTQDYSLIHILNQYSTDLWRRQIALIMAKHGLASFIVHPDYVTEVRARAIYESLLAYLDDLKSQGKIWIALPGEVNEWWRARSQMKLVPEGSTWRIEGPEKDRARLAYAVLDGDRVRYELEPQPDSQGFGLEASREIVA